MTCPIMNISKRELFAQAIIDVEMRCAAAVRGTTRADCTFCEARLHRTEREKTKHLADCPIAILRSTLKNLERE